MSKFNEFLLDEDNDDNYTTILDEVAQVNEAAPVVSILQNILSHIVSLRKECESVISLVEDPKLKKHLKTFVVSAALLSGVLKLVTQLKK